MVGEGFGIVCIDDAVAEVSDKQIVAEEAEARRREGDAPGSVEIASRNDAGDEISVDVEGAHDTVTNSADGAIRRCCRAKGVTSSRCTVIDGDLRDCSSGAKLAVPAGDGSVEG